MTLADKIVVLSGGRIEQVGSPHQLYHHPANRFVAGFIGSPKMNFIEGTVARIDHQYVHVALPGGVQAVSVLPGSLKVGDTVTLGVRPEHLQIAAGGPIAARVTALESLGDHAHLYAEASGAAEGLIVRIPDDEQHSHGEALALVADPERCHLFDAEGQALVRVKLQQAA